MKRIQHQGAGRRTALSVPSTSGLRDETEILIGRHCLLASLSVPSTSGLRDETCLAEDGYAWYPVFQYPQPRVYAMKLTDTRHRDPSADNFQYPQPRVYAMKPLSKDVQEIRVPVPFSTLNLGSTR